VAVLWDPGKATSNVAKHGVRFADAAPVFEDSVAITVVDDESDAIELRFVILGAGGYWWWSTVGAGTISG
jgi:hypothetical protein